jgi:hypothetical protein
MWVIIILKAFLYDFINVSAEATETKYDAKFLDRTECIHVVRDYHG